MACLPDTPIATHVLSDPATDGWQSLGTGLITSALSQYYPLVAAVVPLSNVMNTTSQHGVLRQLDFEETATSSANIKKCPLLVLIYGQPAPTTPTSGQVYNNAATTTLMGVVEIAQSDYKRVSDTVWLASVKPNLYLRTGVTASSTTVNLVILSNSATSVTFAASATARIRGFFEQSTAQ